MKKFVLILGFLSIVIFTKAQYITNGDFESWTTGSDPTGWTSPNSLTSGFGITTVTKETTDVYAGVNSANLTTKGLMTYSVPGILTNGAISVNMSAGTASITGGKPFTQRPDAFTGYYKYTPASGDACVMTVFIFKWNGASKDTIGYAQFSNTSAVSSWTQFSATFTYNALYASETPDTIQVSVFSSNPTAAVVGSILLVDNLNLEGGTLGMNKISLFKNINIFPNPSTDIINVQFNNVTKAQTTISIYSLVGQKVKETVLPIGTELSSINVRSLNKGMYFLSVQSGKDKYTQKISIE